MAQTLKPQIRESIINASKEEFLKYGYENASMRRIAKKANMTVGNLYRYFKNKEDINAKIIEPCLKELKVVTKNVTKSNISLETRVFDVKFNIGQLLDNVDTLIDQLIDIRSRYTTEFKILMNSSEVRDNLIEWLSKLANDMVSVHYESETTKEDVDLLAKSYALSIYDGLIEMINTDEVDIEKIKTLSKHYFRSCIYMLDTDTNKFFEK